jgi:glycosyltransferase involved in cell wall biosynthesis
VLCASKSYDPTVTRVVQSAGFYYPESFGGTEVYVSSLVKHLESDGIESIVVAPSHSGKAFQYWHDGIEVFRYPVPLRWLRREIQGQVPLRQLEVFEHWLYEQRAGVYHQHSWTTACGLWHLKVAKRLGLKTVVTVHVPGIICMRGTMLHEGRAACDGKILAERCASCWLQSKGLAAGVARPLAKLPERLRSLGGVPLLGPVLAAHALAVGYGKQLREMAEVADRIIAVCGWLHGAMLANGVPADKLVLNRQGVGHCQQTRGERRERKARDVVRFGFLGRWDPVKGVHVLIEAIKRLPTNPRVELDVCAVGEGSSARIYRENVQRFAAGDCRIRFLSPIPQKQVAAFLAGIDALVVPSQWLETGPIVVLEAFAAGTPVIGSDLGGIRELVSDEHNGLLVPHNDSNAWTAALNRLSRNRALLEHVRKGIGPVRTMSDVAHDMAATYRDVTKTKPHAA